MKCLVYGLYLDNDLIYIGRTTRLPARLSEHRSNPKMCFDSHLVLAICESEKAAHETEARLIKVLRPMLNRRDRKHNFGTARRFNTILAFTASKEEKRLIWAAARRAKRDGERLNVAEWMRTALSRAARRVKKEAA